MIKYDIAKRSWSASAHVRHPITKMPMSIRRDMLESEKEAQRVQFQLVRTLEHKIKSSLEPKWPQALNEFEAELAERDISNKTKQTYIMCLNAAVGSDWDDKFVSDLTATEIKHVIKYKRGEISESHRKSLRKFFNSFFEFAIIKGYASTNPTPKIKFKIGQKIETTLNYSQCSTLVKLAKEQNHEFYPIWLVALLTGMRNGELMALQWKHVDFERRQIKVEGSWHALDGFKDYTKTCEDRIVPANQQLVEFLEHFKKDSSPDDLVLPRFKKWESGEQSKALAKFLKENNLPIIRFHDLRATCSTLLLSKGVPLAVVMRVMGWKQLKTAHLYYRKSAIDVVGATDSLKFL